MPRIASDAVCWQDSNRDDKNSGAVCELYKKCPPSLLVSILTNPELVKQIPNGRRSRCHQKPTQPISPTGVKLVPNPFYNPELAKQLISKQSMLKKL
ncbi:unnamed protein product [Caenorhabditis nigoni]